MDTMMEISLAETAIGALMKIVPDVVKLMSSGSTTADHTAAVTGIVSVAVGAVEGGVLEINPEWAAAKPEIDALITSVLGVFNKLGGVPTPAAAPTVALAASTVDNPIPG